MIAATLQLLGSATHSNHQLINLQQFVNDMKQQIEHRQI